MGCDMGVVESVQHFVMECPAYSTPRARLISEAQLAWTRAPGLYGEFETAPSRHQLAVLLGKRIGAPECEDRLDRACKRYLRKAWNLRAPVTTVINDMMGTKYEVFTHFAR